MTLTITIIPSLKNMMISYTSWLNNLRPNVMTKTGSVISFYVNNCHSYVMTKPTQMVQHQQPTSVRRLTSWPIQTDLRQDENNLSYYDMTKQYRFVRHGQNVPVRPSSSTNLRSKVKANQSQFVCHDKTIPTSAPWSNNLKSFIMSFPCSYP